MGAGWPIDGWRLHLRRNRKYRRRRDVDGHDVGFLSYTTYGAVGGREFLPSGVRYLTPKNLTPTGVDNIPITVGTALPVDTTVASFTDANTSAAASDFTASINCGDGTVTAGTVVGSVGNSGDAIGGVTHDHFEWHPNVIPPHPWRSPYGYTVVNTAIDPFPYLNMVC